MDNRMGLADSLSDSTGDEDMEYQEKQSDPTKEILLVVKDIQAKLNGLLQAESSPQEPNAVKE